MQKTHRVFIAISLPSEVQRELYKTAEQNQELPAKWESREKLHITLAFLGNISGEELAEVCMVAKEVAEMHEVFTVALTNIALVPDVEKPKIIWAGGEASDALQALKNDLDDALEERIGFKSENRGFAPHVTLARVSAMGWRTIDPEERPDIAKDIHFSFDVATIEVMESVKQKGGSAYEVIESHELQ